MANRKQEFERLWSSEGIHSCGGDETRQVGAWLAGRMGPGSVMSLEGPLGAGKTQLVKGLVAALGFDGTVTSPSFALVHEYVGGRWPVFHFDCYRMRDVGELETVGYDDCLAVGVTVIEWGNKFPEALPPDAIRLRIDVLSGSERCIRGEKS